MDLNDLRDAELKKANSENPEKKWLGRQSVMADKYFQLRNHQTSIVNSKCQTFKELGIQGTPISESSEFTNLLKDSFNSISPLIYLNTEQRNILLTKMNIIHFKSKTKLFSTLEHDDADFNAFILLKGSVEIFNQNKVFEDILSNVTLFGYDGPIFNTRNKIVFANENSTIGVIHKADFLDLIVPFSKFCMYITKNIITKDKTLDSLKILKDYILSSINQGPIDMDKLLDLYLNIDSCLHPKAKSIYLDTNALSYALNRLPQNVLETYAHVLTNVAPKVLLTREEISNDLIPLIKTNARLRDTYKFIEGKNVICVREMETDVFDYLSNMCILMIECKKIRNFIGSPIIIEKLFDCRADFDDTVDVLNQYSEMKLQHEDINNLRKLFPDNLGKKFINIILHYQNHSISVTKLAQNNLDSVENWVQNVWDHTRELLNVTSNIDEVDDLIVDIVQGSKRTLIGCISPHLYQHAEEINKWAEDNKIQLITKEFPSETDKLLANSYYYYKAHPEKQKEREIAEKESGIKLIDQTFGTGISVLLINLNKLNPKYMDPSIKFKSVSRNHIILHIGYTFGAQSSQVIKPLLMLFGSKARSMNIIGKAGGLTGNRTDILVADRMFYDKNHDLSNINFGNLVQEDLERETKSKVHLGPMLCVAGTILQNSSILRFYKYVMGCVGLEMEGYFFIKEINNAINHRLVKSTFLTRCFYYASDLPLDPTQNLSMEAGNVSWDEGVCSMNAIMRIIFNKIFSDEGL